MNVTLQPGLDPATVEALSEAVADRAVAALVTTVAAAIREGRLVKKAWAKQDSKQVRKHGTEGASWYAEWVEPDGTRRMKSFGPGPEGKALAEREADRIAGQLERGTYQTRLGGTWAEFRARYERDILSGHSLAGREQYVWALDVFQRIARPGKMTAITT